MGLTKTLPHLVVFALQLFLRTSCLLSIIVASASLMGTKKHFAVTFITICYIKYRTSRRCGDRDAASARFNQITDERIVHTFEYKREGVLSGTARLYFSQINKNPFMRILLSRAVYRPGEHFSQNFSYNKLVNIIINYHFFLELFYQGVYDRENLFQEI